jgi:SAM-dependent methyltransferase
MTVYGPELADVYDQVYAARKDHAAEAAEVLDLIRKLHPDARSLLDVACGTGAHLRHFAAALPAEGLELSADMVAAARRRHPELRLHTGDMRDFRLGRTYSAVTCMFSSIGHLATGAELDATLQRFAAHLEPGGVVVIEPWYFPETFLDGYVGSHTSTAGGRTVARVSHSRRSGDRTLIEVHYVVAEAAGIRHFVDRHEITLFTREQYETAFRRAGLTVDYLPGGPSGRGLFAGVAA